MRRKHPQSANRDRERTAHAPWRTRGGLSSQDGADGLVALVVPADSYVDDVLGRAAASASVLGKWRKTFDLSQLTKEAASAPVGFNTMGWDSSYTRQPIPLEEMREWLETTVADILQLAPKSAI